MEPSAKYRQDNARNPSSPATGGCITLARVAAVLGASALAGAFLAAFVLLLGPKDALGDPNGAAFVLAYAAFAFACIAGAALAWFIESIAVRKRASAGATQLKATPPADDRPRGAVPLPGPRADTAQPTPDRAPSNDPITHGLVRPRTAQVPKETIPRPPAIAPKKQVDSQRPDPTWKSRRRPRKPPPEHAEETAATPVRRCSHGKRRGYCALCDSDAYKEMHGRWEED